MGGHWSWRAGVFVALVALGCRERAPASRSLAQRVVATPGGADILTFHGDNARTGWNRRETVLTPANVRPETFGRLPVSPEIEGEVTGSPLFASNLPVHDASTGADVTSDVVFVATMDNHVYALASDDLHVLWHFDFEGRRPPIASEIQPCQADYHVGIMSTPVISPDRQLIYVVGRIPAPGESVLLGYALRTRDGSIAARFRVGETLAPDGARVMQTFHGFDRGTPVTITFAPNQYTQRAALLLQGNYLYVATGIFCSTPGARAWLFAYDVRNLSERNGPTGVWMPAPSGGGGIWAAGGPAGDEMGVYVTTGNGRAALRVGTRPDWRSFGDALVHLDPTLHLDDTACFSLASPSAPCGPGDQSNLRNVFMPRYAELNGREHIPDDVGDEGRGPPDLDLGSSGPMLPPPAELPENQGVDGDHRLAVVGGKDGFLYLVDRERMGGIGPSPLMSDADLGNLVGAELDGQMLYPPSASGGMRVTPAFFESRSGRYIYTIGGDELGGRADAPRGLTALRLTRVSDPTPEACAAQRRWITYDMAPVPCATIWGAAPRPGFELAWSGTGPLQGNSPFVSSNGHDNGIVWVGFESTGREGGRLQAYPADNGPGTGRVVAPIYDSERVPEDALPGNAANLASVIVANGRVYVTGSFGLRVYGLLPERRALPPVMEPPAPPDCEPGVSWENFARPFMVQYCTGCHVEYNDLGFTRRRNMRVANSILTESGEAGTMPPRRDPPVPMPSDAERARITAWLRCGAPATRTRVHAGWEDIAAPGGAFTGDGYMLDPNMPGELSVDRLGNHGLVNPFAPEVPDRVFALDRAAPARIRVPVPGQGHYAVSLYFAENACTTGGPECHSALDVALNGTPWLSGFDVLGRAGSVRRAIVQSTAIDLAAGSRLTIDLTGTGRLQAMEVVRTEPCSDASACPTGFTCETGTCVPDETRRDGGIGPDAGVWESGVQRDGLDGSIGDPEGGMENSGTGRNCSCRTAGSSRGTRNDLLPAALFALILVSRRVTRARARR